MTPEKSGEPRYTPRDIAESERDRNDVLQALLAELERRERGLLDKVRLRVCAASMFRTARGAGALAIVDAAKADSRRAAL